MTGISGSFGRSDFKVCITEDNRIRFDLDDNDRSVHIDFTMEKKGALKLMDDLRVLLMDDDIG